MNRSKQKGDREEREVVNTHLERGVQAKRTLEAGARSDGSATWDIDVYPDGIEGAALIGECKVRSSGFKEIYKWKGENDFLTIRADRKERLYIINEELWFKLIKNI